MIDKLKENIEFCKCHWKTLFIGTFIMHFIFDWFIFALGFIIGSHYG